MPLPAHNPSPSFLSPTPVQLIRPCQCQPSRSPARRLRPRVRVLAQAHQPAPQQQPPNIWKRITTAIPLSRAFADHLGPDVLIQLSSHKYKVLCPFHNDNNPSLHIDDSLGLFHCFGCTASGNILHFQQLISGHRSLPHALRALASRYPQIAALLSYIPNPSSSSSTPPHPSPSDLPAPIPQRVPRAVHLTHLAIAKDVLNLSVHHYQRAFWNPDSPHARNYMQSRRRFSEPALRAYAVGYAPISASPDALLSHLSSHDQSTSNALLAGVVRTSSEYNPDVLSHIDVLRRRVILPIRDVNGVTVALAGRVLPEASTRAPKYVNTSNTVLFKKQNHLFGADLAKRASSATAEENSFLFLFEGYLDVMALFDHTQGRVACVASMGTAVSPAQLHLAFSLLNDQIDGKIILNFDADDAGFKAVQRLCDSVIPNIAELAHAVYIAFPPPPVKDADEFLSAVGKADQYVQYLLTTCKPWYQWSGDRVVEEELLRLKDQDDVIVNINDPQLRDELVSPANFDFALADYIRAQSDDMLVAFGASPNIVDDDSGKKKVPAPCADSVLGRLAEILVSAHRVLPGLNVAALVQSWADPLSRARPAELLPIYRKIMDNADVLAKPWSHLTTQAQLYWQPPSPWVFDELPPWKRKQLMDSSGFVPTTDDVGELELFLANKKRQKRSFDKLKYQVDVVMPILMKYQCEEVRRLKISPRRSAEEIILRALIFAEEADRLDGLAAALEVIIRCQQNNLPFWTSDAREQLFHYLGNVEGPSSWEEIAASIEEFDWFPEIEQLFVPIENVEDEEWKSIRVLEIKEPVKVATVTAASVEAMAAKVASRVAIGETGQITRKLLKLSGEKGKSQEEEQQRLLDVEELSARQSSLRKEISRSKFMTEKEAEYMNDDMSGDIWEMKMQAELDALEKKLDAREPVDVPDWIAANTDGQFSGDAEEGDSEQRQ